VSTLTTIDSTPVGVNFNLGMSCANEKEEIRIAIGIKSFFIIKFI
jgi:hypothetical protein